MAPRCCTRTAGLENHRPVGVVLRTINRFGPMQPQYDSHCLAVGQRSHTHAKRADFWPWRSPSAIDCVLSGNRYHCSSITALTMFLLRQNIATTKNLVALSRLHLHSVKDLVRLWIFDSATGYSAYGSRNTAIPYLWMATEPGFVCREC